MKFNDLPKLGEELDAASIRALLREFIEAARNVKANLDRIAESCEKDQAEQAAPSRRRN